MKAILICRYRNYKIWKRYLIDFLLDLYIKCVVLPKFCMKNKNKN